MSSITLSHISKSYPNGFTAVKDFNLEIGSHEFIVLVGPSGCGKSTTLRMIAGLEEISGGELWIGDRLVNSLDPGSRNLAMVFQNYALYPNMTVYQNMAFGLKAHRMDRKEIDRRVRSAAKMLQIDHLLDHRPSELSGGQKQRVAIGSAIVRDADAYLLDEPLSNLDAKLRSQMRVDLKKIFDSLQAAMIYVTHDQVEAMTLATRIVVMNAGIVQQAGTPQEVYENPANRFVAGFIGLPQMNFLEADLVTRDGKTFLDTGAFIVPLPGQFQKVISAGDGARRQVEIGIRPEDLALQGDFAYAIPYIPDLVENLGSHLFVYGNAGSHRMTVRLDADELERQSRSALLQEIKQGKSLQLYIRPDRLHLFDLKTGMSMGYACQAGNGGNENERN